MSGLKSKEALARSPRRPGTPRERAEPRMRAAPAEVVAGSGDETRRLVRELEAHRVELATQNVALLNAQADLAHARDRFADLYDFAPIAYLTVDTGGAIREANLTAGNVLGIARRQLVGRKFEQFVAPEQQRGFRRYQRAVLESAQTRGCDLTVRRRDGSTFAARIEGMRIDDFATRAPLWRCVISDISERTCAEQALRAREAEVERLNADLGRRVDERTAQLEEQRVRLQAIVDTVAEGIISFDQQGVIDSINAAALQIFGYRNDEMRGRAIGLLVPEAGTVMRDLQAGEPTFRGLARSAAGRHKDGRMIELELSLSQIELPDARRFVAVVRDVSEKRRLETQLRERQEDAAQLHRLRTAGELAGVLAHQLNQPLTAILGFAEAATGQMRRGAIDPDQLSGTLAEIAEQAHRAAQVIRDLRQFLARERAEMIPADLNATVQHAYELMSVLANDAGVSLGLALAREIAPVPMLRAQIEQVLLILIDNAIDAILDERAVAPERAPRAAVIGLSTALAADGACVLVTVRDSGPGLDQARAERVFDPLYTTKANGVGLGLSIARSVIEAHGGRIWAEPGSAGVFHFKLPVNQ